MKLRNHQFSIQPQIFEKYKHPWYEHNERLKSEEKSIKFKLIKPNPPSKEDIERAKFVDKTYHWSGGTSVRPRDERSTQ